MENSTLSYLIVVTPTGGHSFPVAQVRYVNDVEPLVERYLAGGFHVVVSDTKDAHVLFDSANGEVPGLASYLALTLYDHRTATKGS